MSIRPLVNNPDAELNKALNITCNTMNCKTIVQDGEISVAVRKKEVGNYMIQENKDQITTGADNIFIGDNSGGIVTEGSNNILVGDFSGDAIVSGNSNICIGSNANVTDDNANYRVAIGNQANADEDEQMKLGGSTVGQSIKEVCPAIDAYCDLGKSTNKFKDVHLSGNINVDGLVDGRDIALDGTNQDNHIADLALHRQINDVGTSNIDLFSAQRILQLFADYPSGLVYKGTWAASTNSPPLASGVGSEGDYYIVNVAGNTNLDGISDWDLTDWVIFNSVLNVWQKVDNSQAPIDASNVVSGTFDNARISSSNVTQHNSDLDHSSLIGVVGTTNSHTDIDNFINSKAQPNGLAELDGLGVVPSSQISSGSVTQHQGDIDHNQLLNAVGLTHDHTAIDAHIDNLNIHRSVDQDLNTTNAPQFTGLTVTDTTARLIIKDSNTPGENAQCEILFRDNADSNQGSIVKGGDGLNISANGESIFVGISAPFPTSAVYVEEDYLTVGKNVINNWNLPYTRGANNQILVTDASGNATWQNQVTASTLNHSNLIGVVGTTNTHTDIDNFISSKAQANGLCPLDASSVVPDINISASSVEQHLNPTAVRVAQGRSILDTLNSGTGTVGVSCVAYSPTLNRYVCGNNSFTYHSDDNGASWTSSASAAALSKENIIWIPGYNKFALSFTNNTRIEFSSDGITWGVLPTTPPTTGIRGIATKDDGSVLIAVGNGNIWRSVDGGDVWTLADVTTQSDTRCVGYGGGNWVIGGAGGYLSYSTNDGLSFVNTVSGQSNAIENVDYGNGAWIATVPNYTNQVSRSADGGATWTAIPFGDFPINKTWIRFHYTGSVWVGTSRSGGGTFGVIYSNDNGLNWYGEDQGVAFDARDSINNGSDFVCVALNGTFVKYFTVLNFNSYAVSDSVYPTLDIGTSSARFANVWLSGTVNKDYFESYFNDNVNPTSLNNQNQWYAVATAGGSASSSYLNNFNFIAPNTPTALYLATDRTTPIIFKISINATISGVAVATDNYQFRIIVGGVEVPASVRIHSLNNSITDRVTIDCISPISASDQVRMEVRNLTSAGNDILCSQQSFNIVEL